MRYIDADELRKESKMLFSTHSFEPVEAYTQYQIDNAPAADVQEVRRGKWANRKGNFRQCSICGTYNDRITDFCPNCGAKMEGE